MANAQTAVLTGKLQATELRAADLEPWCRGSMLAVDGSQLKKTHILI